MQVKKQEKIAKESDGTDAVINSATSVFKC